MVKALLIPLLALGLGVSFLDNKQEQLANNTDYKSCLVTSLNERNNYTLNSISSFTGSEFRLYHYDDLLIDEVSDTAFSGQTFTTLMLTNSVTHISKTAFDNCPSITKIKFTGSKEEYQALGDLPATTYFYACDEGFMNYWNKYIRPEAGSNICSISKATFQDINVLYKNLSTEDLAVVDATKDLAGATIKESMKELIRVFSGSEGSQKTEEWNQTGAITLIIIVAVIGMTSITIFFLLKTKHIIE